MRHASLALVIGALVAGAENATLSVDTPLVLTQVPVQSADPAAGTPSSHPLDLAWLDRSRLAVLSPEGGLRILTPDFHAARDPDVSFDGQRILFAGKRGPADSWRIWEIGADGTGLRPVTPSTLDAAGPIYVSTLFTLDSPEPWLTAVFVGYHATLAEAGRPLTSSLYNVKLDGTELRRITFNPSASRDPYQMWDGRVIYATERHPQEPGIGPARHALHAIHIEGADMEYYGGGQGQRFQGMPCATETGWVVFVESDESFAEPGGQLAAFNQSRPTATYQPLTGPGSYRYLHPAPLAGDTVLVARRPDHGREPFRIVAFHVRTRAARSVFALPEFHVLQAKPLRPRPMPDGHSTVVDLGSATGVFYGMNCYTADEMRQAHLEPGSVKRVRFIEGLPAAATASAPDPRAWPLVPRRLIGEAPVETDGSFNVEVPADTPLLLQTLDERGLALGTCGWIWVKPKETRGCVGCHEDPELVPENEYVLALRRPSNRLTLPPGQRRALGFREHIAPLLAVHCATADCHGNDQTPLHLPLSAKPPSPSDVEVAYRNLLVPRAPGSDGPRPVPGRYVDAGRARTSWLIWQLTGMNTARPWDLEAGAADGRSAKIMPMPPPDKGRPLDPEALRTVIQWIDLGAPFDTPAAPGNQEPPERP